MNEELVKEARNKAGGYFKEGYNCAEAVFLTFKEYLAPDMNPEVVKLMTGLGGGMGHAGSQCAALTASVASINLLVGRTSNAESREEAYRHAHDFHDRFQERFGSTSCSVLNEYPFETKEHLTHCLKITGNTGKLLMEYLLEKGLYK